jgi:hypothetical protein
MGRSAHPRTEDEVAGLSLDQLNAEITRCLNGYELAGASDGAKAFFKRLIWLEAQRERLHGVPAKTRRFRR